MHPRLEELFGYAASTRAALLATVEPLPREALFARPGADRWSPAETLEHLAYVERALGAYLRGVLNDAVAKGIPADASTESVLQSLDRFGVATRKGRVTSSERVRPRGELEPEA